MRLILIRSFAMILAVMLPHSAVALSAANYYERAQRHVSDQNFKAAAVELKNALDQDPGHLPSLVLMGKSLVKIGDILTAEKYLQSAMKRGARDEQLITLMGSIYLAQEKYQQVLDEIKSGGRSTSVETQILVLRGHAYLDLGKYEQAADSFRSAERLLPGESSPAFGLATLEIRRGNLDAAEKMLARAEALGFDDADLWYAKAEIHRLRGEYALALQDLDECLARRPKDNPARITRAALLIDQGEKISAQREIDLVLENDPYDLSAVYLNAIILMQEGRQKDAAEALNVISNRLSVVPEDRIRNHGPTLLLMGTMEYLRGETGKSITLLKRYVDRFPHHLPARLTLGGALMKQGDEIGTILLLKPMLARHLRNADLLTLLGRAYLDDGQFDVASRHLEAAVLSRPDDASIHRHLARAKLAEGDKEAAVRELKAAFVLAPDETQTGLSLARLQLQMQRYGDALETTGKLRRKNAPSLEVHSLAATAHLGNGEPGAAREQLEAALRMDPEYYPAILQLARIELTEGTFNSARDRYDLLLRRRPESITVMSDLARLELLQNRPREAIAWLEKIRNLEKDANISPQLLQLAASYLQTKQPKRALDVTRELQKLLPTDNRVYELHGRAHLLLGNKRESSLAFRRILLHAPESSVLLARIASLLLEAGDVNYASEAIEQALEKDPDNLVARKTRIEIGIQKGDLSQAKALAKQLRKEHPELPIGSLLVGDILMDEGDYEGAAKAYAAAHAAEPGTELLLKLFRAKRAAGNTLEADKLLDDWLNQHPGDVLVIALLATLESRAGNLEKARDLYQRLAKLESQNYQVFNNLAGIYQKLGDPRALATARRAHALAPDQAAANDTLGWILVQQGNHEEGLIFLREAHARTFQHPVVSYHLGVALNGLGRKSEALRELKAALATGKPFTEEAQARALLNQIENP